MTTPVEAPAAAPSPAPTSAPVHGYYWGTGRRKTSVARVRLRPGAGSILVNRRLFDQYFPTDQHRLLVLAPLKTTGSVGKFDVWVRVEGGGPTGQAGAICLGVARALRAYDEGFEPGLRDAGLLTRDSRRKERKHYGRKGARRAFQWTKR